MDKEFFTETFSEETNEVSLEEESANTDGNAPNEIIDSVKISEKEIKEGLEEARKVEEQFKKEKPKSQEDSNLQKAILLHKKFYTYLQKSIKVSPDNSAQKETLSTGFDLLDAILGGGLAIGTMSMIIGTPGSGKSMLAAQIMGRAVNEQSYDSFISTYLDSEEAMTTSRLRSLGVKNPVMNPMGDVTVEKVFKVLDSVCIFRHEEKIPGKSLIIWDSIANTSTEKERSTTDPNQVIGYKARLLSLLLPSYVARCTQNDICFLTINQLRDRMQMGQFAPAADMKFLTMGKEIPGGNSLKFNCFQLMELKVRGSLKPETYGFRGIAVAVNCIKNKLFSPNIPITLIGSFTTGFSNFWSNFEFLKTCKVIEAKGGWMVLNGQEERRFRTKDASRMYRENDKGFKDIFDKALSKYIKSEITDKYGLICDSDNPPQEEIIDQEIEEGNDGL